MKAVRSLYKNIKLLNQIITTKSKKMMYISCSILVFTSILGPFTTWIYKMLIDSLNENSKQIIYIIILYIFIQLLVDMLDIFKSHIKVKLDYNLNSVFIKNINEKLSTIKFEELEKPTTYDLLDRVSNNMVTEIKSFVDDIFGLVISVVNTGSYCILLFQLNWIFPIVIVVTSVPYFFVAIKQGRETYHQKVEQNKNTRKLQYLNNIFMERKYAKDIRMFKLFEFFNNKIVTLRNCLFSQQLKLLIKQIIKNTFTNILRNLALGSCLVIICYEVYQEKGKIGDIFVVITAIQAVILNISNIIEGLGTLNVYTLYMHDWKNFQNLDQISIENQRKVQNYTINFKNVYFRYPLASKDTLCNINFEIGEGKKIALVGENGSGKTTLVNLLLGLYDLKKGQITIGNIPLNSVIQDFRKITVSVFQDYNKYQFSVKDNIKAGNLGEDFNYDLLQSDLLDFVEKLPYGANTNLGQMEDESFELSGGEWQKIALARALIRKNTKILIMDEPTASLDPTIENEIYQDFTNMCNGKTTIMISHRLSVTKLCDEIIVLDKGKIVEKGNHEVLYNKKGKYYHMYKAQSQLYN